MFASISRAWNRAFNPQPLPAPVPIRFDLDGCQAGPLHIVILGAPGGGKSRLARQIWSALEEFDRSRTYLETGYTLASVEQEMCGDQVDVWLRGRARGTPTKVVAMRGERPDRRPAS